MESATGAFPRIPTIPHMMPSLRSGLHAPMAFAEVLGPARFFDLASAPERQRIRGDVVGDNGAGADISTRPDLDRGDERRIGADERIVADLGAVLGVAIIIASDRTGADVGGSA